MSDTFCLDCEVLGDCCYWTSIIDGQKYRSYRCPFLDENNLCEIYEKRHEINPTCMTHQQALDLDLYPKKCKYLQKEFIKE